MRNSENSSARSKFAAVTRIGLLVLIFAVVFATVLSCGVFGENTSLNNGSAENVAEAGETGSNGSIDMTNLSYSVTSGNYSRTVDANSLGEAFLDARLASVNEGQGMQPITISVDLNSVQFSSSNVHVYNPNKSVELYQTGAGSFGGNVHYNVLSGGSNRACTATVNLSIPLAIRTLLGQKYDVSVEFTGQFGFCSRTIKAPN